MRAGVLLTAAIALSWPTLAIAADPPIVFQTQPLGRLLDETRNAAQHLGGDKAVMSFNDEIKKKLGEKGFEGFDLNRPIVGYIQIPADPKDSIAVLAIPTTDDKEFLEFCERWNGSKPKALPGGLYEVPALTPGLKARMRIVNGYAYIAAADGDPAAALDPKAIVIAPSLFDANDQSLATGRVYFNRLPKELRGKLGDYVKQAVKAIGPAAGSFGTDALDQFVKLSTRYLNLSEGAREATLRLKLDPGSGEIATEFTLTATPGSNLAKALAAQKPTMNRFAEFFAPNTVAGFHTRLPLFNAELQQSAIIGLEALRKENKNNGLGSSKALVEELLLGAIRTVKTGEFDLAVALRGPAKDGTFTGVAAISYDDPSALEKELKKFIDAEAPPDFRQALKWDAAKVGTVSIHTLDIAGAGGLMLDNLKRTFGDKVVLAFAFAPKAIYITLSADPVSTMKELLAAKPAAAPVLNVLINSARLVEFVELIADVQSAAKLAESLGKDNKLNSALSLSITGGVELKVKLTMSLKLLPRFVLFGASL